MGFVVGLVQTTFCFRLLSPHAFLFNRSLQITRNIILKNKQFRQHLPVLSKYFVSLVFDNIFVLSVANDRCILSDDTRYTVEERTVTVVIPLNKIYFKIYRHNDKKLDQYI